MVQSPDEAQGPLPLMPALRATAIVGLGSVLTLGMSVISMKVFAILVGPDGVGLLALMQSIVNLGVIVTGLGVATSAIGRLAAALARGDRSLIGAVERAASSLGFAGGLVGAIVLISARDPLARYALGSSTRNSDVLILAPALLFAAAASVQIALLNGQHRIRAVTSINIGTSLAAAGFGIALVAAFGSAGLAPSLLVTGAVQLAFSLYARRRQAIGDRPPTTKVIDTARNLLRLGIPVAGSQLASGGAAFLVPLIVLQTLGQTEVGQYRAASALAIGYLTFFIAGLTQDYLPRLSAARSDSELRLLIERRMRLVMGLGVPIILGLLAAGPWAVEWLYSIEFAPAVQVLQWQLVGDLLRLPAWILAFVLLARQSGKIYLGVEVLGGVTLIAASFLGMELIGIAGAGVGYLASQIIYFAAVWYIVRRQVSTTPGRLQAVLIALAVACGAILLLDPPPLARLLLFGTVAALMAAVAWPRMYRLHQKGEL